MTPEDIEILEQQEGIDKIFRAGEGDAVLPYINEHLDFSVVPEEPKALLEGVKSGDELALSRLINLAEEKARLDSLIEDYRNGGGPGENASRASSPNDPPDLEEMGGESEILKSIERYEKYLSSLDEFDWLLHDLPAAQIARLELSWPGTTTWLVPHSGQVPRWICGDYDTVAVRVSPHPQVQALCDACGTPIVSTSANIAGTREARHLFQVYKHFGGGLDYVLPGALGGSIRPSMIRDLVSDTLVRPG